MRDGISDHICQALELQLFHEIVPVNAHGVDTDKQNIGDLLGFFTLGQEFQDFSFASGKGFSFWPRLSQIKHYRGKKRGKVFVPLSKTFYGPVKLGIRILLEQETISSGFEAQLYESFFLVHSQKQDLDLRIELLDFLGSLQPPEIRHGNVQDDQVRLLSFEKLQELYTVVGLAAYRNAVYLFDDFPYALAEDGMVVSQQDLEILHLIAPQEQARRMISWSPVFFDSRG